MRILRFCLRPCSIALLVTLLSWSGIGPLVAQERGAPELFAPELLAQARQTDRVLASADPVRRVELPGHRAPWQADAVDLGALPNDDVVQLIVGLSRAPEVQAAFKQLLADQQNPSSPRYRQWLSPQQVGEQFGPTPHDLDALTQWLTAQGFKVDSVEPSRMVVHASAPAATVAAALGSSLHRYRVELAAGGSETRQAPVAEPSLPAALSPIVSYIGGLNSVPMHLHSHMQVLSAPAASATPASALLRPELTANGANTIHFLTPLDFNKIYDITGSGYSGSNQKVMIVGGSRLNPPDLSYFEADTAVPAYTPNYIVGPGFADPGQTNDDNMGEGTLDFERVYGTAQGATIDQVIALNWLNGTVNANLVLYAINTVNDPILTLSFGACEAEQSASYVRQEDAVYSQAAAQGISVFVSSGDGGVTGCAAHGSPAVSTTQQVSINDICASSYVTCVGATQFNDTVSPGSYWSSTNTAGFLSAFGYIPEGGWNEPTEVSAQGVTSYVIAASTGGPSTVISKPTWQTVIGVPSDGARDTPDISFSGSGHDGYFSCLAYTGGTCVPNAQNQISFVVFSGTSASAPSMAGIAALIDQKLGGRQGNMNPVLYRTFASNPSVFHDATIASSGVATCTAGTPSACNNSTPGPSSLTVGAVPGYLLGTGYDLVTGLGSLDVSAYLTAISAINAPPATVLLTPASANLTATAGTTVTDTVTVASTNFSGTQNLTCAVNFNGPGTATNTPVCSFSPSSVVFTGTGSATVTLTLTSVKSSALKGGAKADSRPLSFTGWGGVTVCSLLALCLPGRRRSLRGLGLVAGLLVFAAALTTLSGCGSGGSFGAAPVTGTTQGSYAVTISSNSNLNQPNNVGYSGMVQLTIQ